eukprot:c5296_g1_i1 orf=2-256(-)
MPSNVNTAVPFSVMDRPPSPLEDPHQKDVTEVSYNNRELSASGSGSELHWGLLEHLEDLEHLNEAEECDGALQLDEFVDMEELQF